MSTQAADFEVLPESRRADGTVRPEVRRKKGYVPPEEQTKFRETLLDEPGSGVVPGSDMTGAEQPRGVNTSKTAQKNQRRNAKRKEEQSQQGSAVVAPSGERVAKDGAENDGAVVEAGATAQRDVTKKGTDAVATNAVATNGSANVAAAESAPSELEKKLKALRKRLRQIEDLAEKQANGTVLNADQKSKIASKADISAEVAKWETLGDVDIQKKIKGLKKKVRQIQEYEERQAKGETLNADQLGKVESKTAVTDELAVVESLMAAL